MKHAHPLPFLTTETAVGEPLSLTQPAIMERRLEDGYQRIEEARLQGRDVCAWEDFWIQLLHEYEDVCDGLRQAAA